jgi:hypothetical protein
VQQRWVKARSPRDHAKRPHALGMGSRPCVRSKSVATAAHDVDVTVAAGGRAAVGERAEEAIIDKVPVVRINPSRHSRPPVSVKPPSPSPFVETPRFCQGQGTVTLTEIQGIISPKVRVRACTSRVSRRGGQPEGVIVRP